MRICLKVEQAGLKPGAYTKQRQEKRTGLKTGHYIEYKTSGCGGAGHALGAAFGYVTVGTVPVDGAFERGGDWAGLET
jgi:hypothetical protein